MMTKHYETATFAGGCFWCLQHDFDLLNGVISTTSGYSGGKAKNPTYEEVCSGSTGHVECVQVVFDPEKVSYETLLDCYWHQIDPTRNDGQFCDIGSQYRPVIFYHSAAQKQAAEKSKKQLLNNKKIESVHVDILPIALFYPAEDYHQDYYRKNPVRYKFYHSHSGRTQRLKELWEDQ